MFEATFAALGQMTSPVFRRVLLKAIGLAAVMLVLITIGLGVYPKPVFDVTRASVAHLVEVHKQGVAAAQADTRVVEVRP